MKAFYLVAILLFATSCTYDFSEDYFKEIQTGNPNVNINFIGFAEGEEISSSRMIRYSISGVGNEDFETVFTVDGEEIHRSQVRSGEFYLFVDDLVDGTHKLTVDFIFPSNSGSLADAVGAEFFIGSAAYNFSVDKSLANSFGIASVDIMEGSIYITLNPVTDDNFEEAYLLIQSESGVVFEERPISQEEITNLKIHDAETVIYNPSYAIKVKNSFTENISDFVLLPTPPMSFTLEPLTYRKFKLIYSGHPLYGNFDRIGFDYTYTYSGSSFHELDPQGGEKTINYGYFFGQAFHINLQLFRNNYPIGNIFEPLRLGGSLPISGFEEITYISSINKYFILDINTANELVVHKLNAESFEVENSQTLATVNYSWDFKSLESDPVSNSLIINMNERAITFDPVNFSVLKVYNAVDYNPAKATADVYYRGEYLILDDPGSSGEVLIYEKATGIQKFSINKTTKLFSSVDAHFFYVNYGLYKLQGGNFVFLETIRDSQNNRDAPALDYMTFDKVSNSAVFGWYRHTYYLDLMKNSQHYLWGPDVVYDVKYANNGKPLINSNHFSAGTKSHIYNVENNEIRTIDTYGEQQYRYFNGVIFSPNGYYLETNLYKN